MRIRLHTMSITTGMIIPCIMRTKHRSALYTAKYGNFSRTGSKEKDAVCSEFNSGRSR